MVSVRIRDEHARWLRHRNISLGTFARKALEDRIRQIDRQEAIDELKKLQYKAKQPAEETTRRMRSTRYGRP